MLIKKSKFSPVMQRMLYTGGTPERSANLQSNSMSFGFTDGSNIDNVKPVKDAMKSIDKVRDNCTKEVKE